MKKAREHVISRVLEGSIAEELELEPGDVLVSVDGRAVGDIFDYHYLTNEEYLTILVRKADGEEWELEIEKEYEEDLGLEFENGLMDDYRSCANRCIFCFIDQMPGGMRDTLYFKDDDTRLSFLQGNYVTLTNMGEADIERIITYRMEPVNISFQTMNPSLRCRMLQHRGAGRALKKVDRLFEAGIEMNGQIVLCKGINDGAELDYSIRELTKYLPYLKSVSVVPVGLTDHRDGLYELEPFGREDACAVVDLIEDWQRRIYGKYGTHFVHAGDEWYLLAGREVPPEESYDGYLQLENGVGMVRLFLEEVAEEVSTRETEAHITGAAPRRVTIATGKLAAPVIGRAVDMVSTLDNAPEVHIVPIENRFFGKMITVAGLVTGGDLKTQLAGLDLGDALLLTENMLRSGESVFLDDVTVEELSQTLQIPVTIVESSGKGFVDALLGEAGGLTRRRGVNPYEPENFS